jgi:hypothetical protein
MKIFSADLRMKFGHASAERKGVVPLLSGKKCATGVRFRGVEKDDALFFGKMVLCLEKGATAKRGR